MKQENKNESLEMNNLGDETGDQILNNLKNENLQ